MPHPLVTLPNIRHLKFRNKLLLSFVIVFVPLILISKILVFVQSQKFLEAGIEKELNQSSTFLTDLIHTAAELSIKNRLKAIAEKNLEIVEYFYSKHRSGLLSRQQTLTTIEEIFNVQSIGISGYIYCINSKGKILFHPDHQMIGQDISNLNFVKDIIKMKDGYLEYQWKKSPTDDHMYPKAAFITYYKPLDWIICVSCYRNEYSHLLDISEFSNYVSAFTPEDTGYVFVIDEDGTAVMHPFLQGKNLLKQPEEFAAVIRQMLTEKNGKLRTTWSFTPEDPLGEQLVIFRYLPQYKWIVGAASYTDETSSPLSDFSTLFTLDILFFLFAFLGLAYLLSRSVTKPLENFTQVLNNSKEGDYSIRLNDNTRDEVGSLARHFNAFMMRLEKFHSQLKDESRKTMAAQNALIANELKRQGLFNQSSQLICILSPYGILEDINESQLEFAQCGYTDLLYKPYWESPWWQHDDQRREEIKSSVEKAAAGQALRLETTHIDGNGTIRDIDISVKPVFNHNKEVEFIVTEARDITEIKQGEQERHTLLIQLQKAQKMEAIGTLAGGIAHDFNNILSSIFGYAQLAQMTLDNPEKLKNHMSQILKGAQRASDLVKQILTFSRQSDNEKHPLKLHLVVKEALKLLRSSIPTTIDIVTKVDTKEMINADPTQMHQMIMNLCTNAYHAMKETGGTMTVSLTNTDQIQPEHQNKDYLRRGPFMRLMVRDTGHGMDQQTIEKAFDPYFTTKEMGHGTGLGLALVKAIVEDHQGICHVESISGHGTSFCIYLPIVYKKKPGETAIDLSGNDHEQGCETIMIVDDEPDICALTEELLKKFGYTVYTFSDGEKAFHAFDEGKINFDMVITDMTMPGMTGVALAESILSKNNNFPIILCSGYNETISEVELKEMGIRAFFEKPLDTRKLIATIQSVFNN